MPRRWASRQWMSNRDCGVGDCLCLALDKGGSSPHHHGLHAVQAVVVAGQTVHVGYPRLPVAQLVQLLDPGEEVLLENVSLVCRQGDEWQQRRVVKVPLGRQLGAGEHLEVLARFLRLELLIKGNLILPCWVNSQYWAAAYFDVFLGMVVVVQIN